MHTPAKARWSGKTELINVNALIVKYTYNGDADLSGKLDADDYFLIDRAFVGQVGVLAAKTLTPAPPSLSQGRGSNADKNVRTTAVGRHGRARHHRITAR